MRGARWLPCRQGAGGAAWDQSVALQAEKESTIAGALTEHEKDQLNDLLRRLLTAFSDAYGPLSKRRA